MNFTHLLSERGPLGWKFYGNPLPLWIAFIVGAALLYGALLWIRRISAARVGVIAALTGERRVVLTIGVNYDITYAKLEKIQSTVREVIGRIHDTRFDRAHFKHFGDSSLDFEIAYFVKWTNFRSYMDVQHAVNLAIFKKFAEDGIEFASATNDLYVHLREGLRPLGERAPSEIESTMKSVQSRSAARRSG
jgi:hypothetical protein